MAPPQNQGQKTRLMKEFQMLQSELPPGILCTPKLESLTEYEAQIDGPPDTPYEHGRFLLDVSLSERYPLEPPTIRFKTRVYHPNIDDYGNICLEVLKTGKNGCWNPSWTLGKVLIALTVLLASPNPDDPLMPEIADLITSDRGAFDAHARMWTEKYAMAYKDDPADYVGGSQLSASPAKGRKRSVEEDEIEDRVTDNEESISAGDQMGAAESETPLVKRKLGLARKIASPSPEQPAKPPLLPPAHGKLPAAGGMRRLGLSRSKAPSHSGRKKKASASAAIAKGSTRFALKPLVMSSRAATSSESSSQAESIELASDDTPIEDPPIEDPPLHSPTVPKRAARTRGSAPSMSRLASPPKQRTRAGGRPARGGGPAAEPRQLDVVVDSAEESGSPVVSAGDDALDLAESNDESEDYGCLLSPGAPAGNYSDSGVSSDMPVVFESNSSEAGKEHAGNYSDSAASSDMPVVFEGNSSDLVKEPADGPAGDTDKGPVGSAVAGMGEGSSDDSSTEASAIRPNNASIKIIEKSSNELARDLLLESSPLAAKANVPRGFGQPTYEESQEESSGGVTADLGSMESENDDVHLAAAPLLTPRGRRKGKAVDYSMPSPQAPGEEHVLRESHFGPLDLGLPPIRVSSQRRLMRRRARDPPH